jgi:hypothetical protein
MAPVGAGVNAGYAQSVQAPVISQEQIDLSLARTSEVDPIGGRNAVVRTNLCVAVCCIDVERQDLDMRRPEVPQLRSPIGRSLLVHAGKHFSDGENAGAQFIPSLTHFVFMNVFRVRRSSLAPGE